VRGRAAEGGRESLTHHFEELGNRPFSRRWSSVSRSRTAFGRVG
jgi:hypothetical protein